MGSSPRGWPLLPGVSGVGTATLSGIQPAGSALPAPAIPTLRILYADDDACIRGFGQLVLTRAGYAVETAADGAEALALLRRDPPDLLITDYQMPRLNGRELIRQMRMAKVAIPVIMISGSLGELPGKDLQRLGCTAMLGKPFTADQLVCAVHDAFHPAPA